MIELNPNCSEATMRLDLTGLTKEEINKLEELLAKVEEEHSSSDNDDENWWFETSWATKDIFGKKVIEIRGDTPFNNSDKLLDEIQKLPFKIPWEIDE
jgi:hypothetical protein